MADATERPLRRDAERNRQRILDAARRVFAARGLSVSMDDIAREAGVGVGTVYRRFPDKDQLIDALFRDGVDGIVAIAHDALANDDPWEGLVEFCERSIERQSADRGLKEILLGGGHGCVHVEDVREQLTPLVEELVTRAQATGDLRPDISVTDFALIQMGLGAIVDYAHEADPDAWRRLLVLVLDGLRARRDAPSPLPVDPLGLEQIDSLMRNWRPARR